jgi:SPP1 family holin
MNKETIIRTTVLFVMLLNQGLAAFGWSPLPFDEQNVELFISFLLSGSASVWAWWKNNSVTKEARKADAYLDSMKQIKKAS